MTDIFDRASELEERTRVAALQAQMRRAGLAGKTVADSAENCAQCDDPIPLKRRQSVPGCQLCVACQARKER